MPDIINLLPEALANQIAAGEVVQRPASVVKELLENAIDAGATKIQLIVKEAGRQLIQVIDNGVGMSETDARMCFERHATSKIKTSDDLFSIYTLGFRGEAMASIAAVAQVEMKTKRSIDELGTSIKIEASEIKSSEPASTSIGTSISVKNLFFNVPARRNFLKSNAVEMRHISEEFHRVALAYPSIAMSFFQNDLEIFNLPEGKLSQRIVNLFGNAYKEQLVPCEENTDILNIHGYIGKPEFSKKTRGEQYFFVNNRFIKNNYLHHAVMNAYKDLVGSDAFPFYVLFFEIDPIHIDINVHPTKTEIKFDDERTIYHILLACIKRGLGTHNIVPSIDFGLNVNFDTFTNHSPEPSFKQGFTTQKPEPFISYQEKRIPHNWESLYKDFDQDISQNEPLKLVSRVNSMNLPTPQGTINSISDNKSTFQLSQNFIVSKVKSGMVIVNLQAAHERILYEKYITTLHNKFGASQQFLFPLTLQLSPLDFSMVMEMEHEIKCLGFDFSIFGKNTIVVNGIPSEIQSGNEKEIFEGLIEQYKTNQSELKLDRTENLARALAKRSSLKSGGQLSYEEMSMLIDKLFACKMPHCDPSGNPTFVLMDEEKIRQLF
ncbi:MAG: DNA mismatch repair endonuclease MutL [Cytophagales bacterium]|nr:MAG: DNA mismatch repair endonuclease MutL [Cytophagales bacterium]